MNARIDSLGLGQDWMHRLAQRIADRRTAAMIVAVVLVFAAACGVLATRVEEDHDLLAFLPADHPDIVAFRDLSDRFGGLDVALVGVETQDVFDPGFLQRLRDTTRAVRELPQVDHVLSLANVDDFAPDPLGGIRTAPLVEALPQGPTERAALRAKVLSRDAVVGTLVDETGTAVVLYAFLASGTERHIATDAVRTAVTAGLPDATLHWGGSPFITSDIYTATRDDLAVLTPWAVIAILVVTGVAFRSPWGVAAGLVATVTGIAAARAAMVLAGVPLNVVLGAMPILLFAIGSAYGIHLLARYQVHAATSTPEEAASRTLVETGPTVLTAGLTTMAGLGSFVLMDSEPLRVFGAFTALGIGVALGTSLLLVPAAAVLFRIPGRAVDAGGPPGRLVRAVMGLQLYRPTFAIVLGLFVLAGAGFTTRVDTRMDQEAFYGPDSDSALADAFLAERFGGAVFVQLQVAGDLADVHVLREVQRVADEVARLPRVSGVQHAGQVLGLLNGAMEGVRRLPDDSAKVRGLYGLLTGHAALRQLVTDERGHGMVVVRLDTSELDAVEETLAAIEGIVGEAPERLSILAAGEAGSDGHRAALVRARLGALVPGASAEALDAATLLAPAEADVQRVVERFAGWLGSSESPVPLAAPQAEAVAEALVAGGREPADAIAEALGLPVDDGAVQDLAFTVEVPLTEARSGVAAEAHGLAVAEVLGVLPSSPLMPRLAGVALDARAPTTGVPDRSGDLRLDWTVSGQPVVYRALSESVTAGQLRSLGVALVLIVALLAWAFRDLRAGLIAATPTITTLLVVYGLMGGLGVHLDLGTSLLAGLILGAGVDYAVHLQSSWVARRYEPLEHAVGRAAARTAPAIWTNALMVALGFAVLTLGDARPLRNVGALTATAMLVSAAMTFLAIPVLCNRKRYLARTPEEDPADPIFDPGVVSSL